MEQSTRLLSYDEVAQVLGIDRESARKRAIRGGWRRTVGNDKRTRVYVPLDVLPVEAPPAPPPSEPLTSMAAYFDHEKCDAFLAAHEKFVVKVGELSALAERLEGAEDSRSSREELAARLAEAEAARDEALAQMAVIDAGRAEMTRELEASRAELERLRGRPWGQFLQLVGRAGRLVRRD